MSAFVILSYQVQVSMVSIAPAVHLGTVGVWVDHEGEDILYARVLTAIKEQHFDPARAEMKTGNTNQTPQRLEESCTFLRTLANVLKAARDEMGRKCIPIQGVIQYVEEGGDVRLFSMVHTVSVNVQWYED